MRERDRQKGCFFWVTSPLWAFFMPTYDVCTHVTDVKNGNFTYAKTRDVNDTIFLYGRAAKPTYLHGGVRKR